MFICECGQGFEDAQGEARDHMLEQHLDLIETRYEDILESDDYEPEEWTEEWTDEEIFDEAVEDVLDDLLDEIVEE